MARTLRQDRPRSHAPVARQRREQLVGAREVGGAHLPVADVAGARERLRYSPSTTLADGLCAEFEWALAA